MYFKPAFLNPFEIFQDPLAGRDPVVEKHCFKLCESFLKLL